MQRATVIEGAALGGLAVAAGAFGAHGLKGVVDAEALAIWETAARYQMYHALALVLVGLAAPRPAWRLAAWCWLGGVVIFSGTLYALTLTGATWLGAITPVGGVLLIAGWLLLLIGAARRSRGAAP